MHSFCLFQWFQRTIVPKQVIDDHVYISVYLLRGVVTDLGHTLVRSALRVRDEQTVETYINKEKIKTDIIDQGTGIVDPVYSKSFRNQRRPVTSTSRAKDQRLSKKTSAFLAEKIAKDKLYSSKKVAPRNKRLCKLCKIISNYFNMSSTLNLSSGQPM